MLCVLYRIFFDNLTTELTRCRINLLEYEFRRVNHSTIFLCHLNPCKIGLNAIFKYSSLVVQISFYGE